MSNPELIEVFLQLGEPVNERAFHSELPNGKPVVAFRTKRLSHITFEPGDRVRALLTPDDFSRAQIEEKCASEESD